MIYFLISEILYFLLYFVKPFTVQSNFIYPGNIFLGVLVLTLLTLVYFKADTSKLWLKRTLPWIFAASIVFNLTLLFLLPLAADDLYIYLARGRILGVHGQNPYIDPYTNFPHDDFFGYIGGNFWSRSTTSYGSLFILVSGLLSKVAPHNFFASVYVFKFFFVALNVLTTYLIYLVTRSKRAAFLWAWNPFVIFEFALNAHMDILMIFLFTMAVYFLLKKASIRNYLAGVVALVFSVFVKYFTLIFLPFILAFVLTKLRKKKSKLVFLAIFLAAFCVIGYFILAPFGGFVVFKRLTEIVGFSSYQASPGVLFAALIANLIGINNPFYFGRVFGAALFVIALLFVILSFIKGRISFDACVKYFIIALSLFFGIFLNWFMPWYLTTLIASLCIYFGITQGKFQIRYLILSTFWGVVSYLIPPFFILFYNFLA